MEEFKFAYLRPVLRINIHLSCILDGTWFYEFSLCLCWCVRMNLGTIRGWLGGDTLTVMDGENGPHGCVCCRGTEVLGRQCQCGTPNMMDQHIFFFLIKEHGRLPTQMVKAFIHHTQACISSSFHDHSAHDNLANSHSTVQRQILPMICSEGAGFQVAGSRCREPVKDWTSHGRLSNHGLP